MNLAEFQHAQQELSAVVRDALTYGPDPALNERFRQRRALVQSNYADMRHSFDRLWTTSADPRRFPGQHTDPIESLLASPTLDGLLKRDARHIERDLQDIETAFELCGEPEVVLI